MVAQKVYILIITSPLTHSLSVLIFAREQVPETVDYIGSKTVLVILLVRILGEESAT